MPKRRSALKLPQDSIAQSLALFALLVIGGLGIAGPSGILAWSENARLLDDRQKELAQLTQQRDELRNRVNLLDPRHADPDLADEMTRKQLGLVRPDEVIIPLN